MLRFTRTAFLTMFSLAASLSGCAENESSLFIEGVLSLPASDCVARPDAEAEMLTQGVLDVHFAQGYVAAVQVGNQLTQQGNREKLRTETSRLHLEGATGTVFDVNGGEHEFEAIATGFAHPAAGTEPGLAAMVVNLINGETMDALLAAGEGDIVVRFRVFGTTLGGKEVESGDYDFPIYLCDGCLVDYPIEAVASTVMPGEAYICGASADAGTEENICFYGQDQRFSCSDCASVDPVCRDPSQNPWNQ
jgi:hypothetical protein